MLAPVLAQVALADRLVRLVPLGANQLSTHLLLYLSQ